MATSACFFSNSACFFAISLLSFANFSNFFFSDLEFVRTVLIKAPIPRPRTIEPIIRKSKSLFSLKIFNIFSLFILLNEKEIPLCLISSVFWVLLSPILNVNGVDKLLEYPYFLASAVKVYIPGINSCSDSIVTLHFPCESVCTVPVVWYAFPERI